MLTGLVSIYIVLGQKPLPADIAVEKSLTGLVGVVPLFVSIIIRWLVLPRYHDLKRAFPMFIAGLALAEAGGLLGIFLGGPYRDDLFLLGGLGMAQYLPFFAKQYLESKAAGFSPGN